MRHTDYTYNTKSTTNVFSQQKQHWTIKSHEPQYNPCKGWNLDQ